MTAMKTGGPIAFHLNDLDFFSIAYHTLHDLASPASLFLAWTASNPNHAEGLTVPNMCHALSASMSLSLPYITLISLSWVWLIYV